MKIIFLITLLLIQITLSAECTFDANTKTVSCTGTGAIINENANAKTHPFGTDRLNIEKLEVADGVTTIPAYMFRDCMKLKTVTLPSSVTEIGEYAFFQTAIETISDVSKVEKIGHFAFSESKLKSIHLPALNDIGLYIFAGCKYLTEASFPNSIQRIEDGTFMHCKSLSSFTISSSVQAIGIYAFSGCRNLHIEVPSSILGLDKGAFMNSGITKVTSSSLFGGIGEKVFEGCHDLTEINWNCKKIPSHTFYYCDKVKSVTIPSKVESIGKNAFRTMEELELVVFEGDTEPQECSPDAFLNTKHLKFINVTENYNKDTFCGMKVCKKGQECVIDNDDEDYYDSNTENDVYFIERDPNTEIDYGIIDNNGGNTDDDTGDTGNGDGDTGNGEDGNGGNDTGNGGNGEEDGNGNNGSNGDNDTGNGEDDGNGNDETGNSSGGNNGNGGNGEDNNNNDNNSNNDGNGENTNNNNNKNSAYSTFILSILFILFTLF